MTQTLHVHLSVRGLIHNGFRDRRYFKQCLKWVTRDDGTRYRDVTELLEALLDAIAKGHEALPMTKQPCEGFDYSGNGCPGHRGPPSCPCAGDYCTNPSCDWPEAPALEAAP